MFCSRNAPKFPAFLYRISAKRHASSSLGNAYQPKAIEGQSLPKENSTKNGLKGVFSMIFPPPNVTGDLHLGHTLTATIQDVIVRRQKEKDLQTLWIPGMDHAGIATQVVVEKNLMRERNLSRYDLGRQQFQEEILKWKALREKSIRDNLKSQGLSFSWDREYYTMDQRQNEAVMRAFIELHEKGIIYRDTSLINWSCSLESAISDVEIDNVEITGPTEISVPGYEKNVIFGEITDVAYKVEGSADEIVVSTTRPETLLGDVAVAVHPEDERYARFRDKETKLWHPFRNTPIPLVFDETVDKNFGTGAVKITPSHDKKDFSLAKRHNLPQVDVIDEKGKIVEGFGTFSSLPRFTARDKMMNSLAESGLLRQTKPHSMILPRCSRSGDVVEYLKKPQWFLRCQAVAQEALEAVKSGMLKISPPEYESEWFRWLENCHDWCISRQIWWGHRIPAYKCSSGEEIEWISASSLAEAIDKARKVFQGGKLDRIERDTDVLDTWFSSGLLPFSVFGWPEKSSDLEKYFPLNLIETGHDILFFWIARMTMLSLLLTEKVPFREVFLHGIICDSQGRKMSKSLGNVILPEQVVNGASLEDLIRQTKQSHKRGVINEAEMMRSIEELSKNLPNGIPECGIDALRFTLCSYNIKNHFINFDMAECLTNKLFFNKIWQATKFTIKAFENIKPKTEDLVIKHEDLMEMDRWILEKLASTQRIVRDSIDQYNFHLATAALKTFFYSNFCNVYLETTKFHINAQNSPAKGHLLTLRTCLAEGLKLMEYFTPFLAHELHKFLPIAPEIADLHQIHVGAHVEEILEICAAIRGVKSQNNIVKKQNPRLIIWTDSSFLANVKNHAENIKTLTMIPELRIIEDREEFDREKCSIKSVANHFCCFGIHVEESIKGIKKGPSFEQKLAKLTASLQKLEQMAKEEGYQRSASAEKKEKHREKMKRLAAEIEAIRQVHQL
ncbi:valine--tRNA ligase [Phlebotomus argentipes]|uniref:valine--tRNA ligase n=1 Tax=Phlebotomus argentipes TaxID=94469 RepID=UPI002893153E|nr:valine--tRNA ligase [Phlebotomus argentipes]